jgi:hypothetical protein
MNIFDRVGTIRMTALASFLILAGEKNAKDAKDALS